MRIFKTLFLFLSSASICFAEITTIQSFSQAGEIGPETLVVFDVDEVLITPEDRVLRRTAATNGFHSQVENQITEELLSIALKGTNYILVDPVGAEFVKALQEKGVKTLALTSSRTGSFGIVESAENWRLEQLEREGIDFSESFPDVSSILFSQNEHPALYKQGILFVGDAEMTKGELLTAFLDRVGFHPQKVVFFDDRMSHLKSMEKEIEKRGIPYQGYHFDALRNDVLDVQIAEKQFQHLVEKKEWLSEIQARIVEADSLEPISHALAEADEKTLVLLDLGGTLLMHKDAVLDTKHENWKRAWFAKHYPNSTKKEIIGSVRVVENDVKHWKLVDEKWPEVIRLGQEQGAKVVALTKVVIDPSLKSGRPALLKELGIEFKDDLNGLGNGTSYEYAGGIVETEANLKGAVVVELLPKCQEIPAKIIFVDDRLEQVQSVAKACNDKNIPCLCFHYTAARKQVGEFDEKIADLQLHTLMEEHRWLSEKEAKDSLEEN